MLEYESTKHAVRSLNRSHLMSFDRTSLQLESGALEQAAGKGRRELFELEQAAGKNHRKLFELEQAAGKNHRELFELLVAVPPLRR